MPGGLTTLPERSNGSGALAATAVVRPLTLLSRSIQRDYVSLLGQLQAFLSIDGEHFKCQVQYWRTMLVSCCAW